MDCQLSEHNINNTKYTLKTFSAVFFAYQTIVQVILSLKPKGGGFESRWRRNFLFF